MSAQVIDFLHPNRQPVSGWVLLALGCVVLAATLLVDRQWQVAEDAAESAWRARTEAAEQQRLAATRPQKEAPEQARWRRIAPQLRQPYLPVFRVIENATEPPIFLTSLALDPSTAAVKLEGEAPSFEHALAYAQQLDEVGLVGPAQLRSHETITDPSGRTLVRFSVVTTWRRW